MKREDICIWKMLVDNRGHYVSVSDLVHVCGMSRRQLTSRMTKIGLPGVEKDETKHETYYILDCTLDEATELTVILLSDLYKCNPVMIQNVIDQVSANETTSLTDVCSATTFSQRDVAYILSNAPAILMSKKGSKNRYIRICEAGKTA